MQHCVTNRKGSFSTQYLNCKQHIQNPPILMPTSRDNMLHLGILPLVDLIIGASDNYSFR